MEDRSSGKLSAEELARSLPSVVMDESPMDTNIKSDANEGGELTRAWYEEQYSVLVQLYWRYWSCGHT